MIERILMCICGVILIVVGLFLWIQFMGSQQEFEITMRFLENIRRIHGKTGAVLAFCTLYVFPIPFGLALLQWRRKPIIPISRR